MSPRPAASTEDRVRQLEAERLAPVPRASHAVAVDLADIAALLRAARGKRRSPGITEAYDRLSLLVRSRS